MIKKIFIIVILIVSCILTFFSYLLSIYEYEWSDDSSQSHVPDSDAILVIVWFTIISIICTFIAFGIFSKKKSLYTLVFVILVILSVYRLVQVIPYYSG